jgi:hypothetical protein
MSRLCESKKGTLAMVKRTREHVIGDCAEGSVSKIWQWTGAAVSKNVKDYGEDLLVLPTLDREVDSFHILIQVKGTEKVRRKENGNP